MLREAMIRVIELANLPVRPELAGPCRIALQQSRIPISRVTDFRITRRGVRYVNATCCTVRPPAAGASCCQIDARCLWASANTCASSQKARDSAHDSLADCIYGYLRKSDG